MRIIRKTLLLAACTALAAAFAQAGTSGADTTNAVAMAQKQITTFLADLADLHCTETVTQEKLNDKGHVMASERDQFDYLIMMSGTSDDFELNESRVEAKDTHHKLLALPMLVTNGMSTALHVFHPYYRSGFEFNVRPEELVDGRPTIPIHFTHIQGRRTPIALALRGREFPLDLEGTAWLDASTKQVVKVEAGLEHDMSDVGLKSLNIQVDYKPQLVGGHLSAISLPTEAIVDVSTPRQHWRNRHVFSNYKSFSTDVEQGPDFKIHSDEPNANGKSTDKPSPQGVPKQQ